MKTEICKYCSKECKNKKSLAQHEIRCKENLNRINVINKGFNTKDVTPWNKGLTKEIDERVKNYGIKSGNAMRGKAGRKHTEKEKQHLRDCAIKNQLGGFHMRKGILYKDIKLDSSYEVILAQSLDEYNIQWERPGRFSYHYNDKLHYYTPDFYLPKYDIYLDPKNDFLINNINPHLGYNDLDKIKQVELEHNIKIIVLNKNQLKWEKVYKLILDIKAPII